METDTLAHTEVELRKRLDLTGAGVTRTSKALVILCRGKRGPRATERCLTLLRDGQWELSGYPSTGTPARIVANRRPALHGGRLPDRDLKRIAAVLRQAAA